MPPTKFACHRRSGLAGQTHLIVFGYDDISRHKLDRDRSSFSVLSVKTCASFHKRNFQPIGFVADEEFRAQVSHTVPCNQSYKWMTCVVLDSEEGFAFFQRDQT